MKICPVGAELFREDRRADGQTDRQTDITKLMVAFRNFSIPFRWPHTAFTFLHKKTHKRGEVKGINALQISSRRSVE